MSSSIVLDADQLVLDADQLVLDADQLEVLGAGFVAGIDSVGGSPVDGPSFESAVLKDEDFGSESSNPRDVLQLQEDEAVEVKPTSAAPLPLALKFVEGHFLEKNGKLAEQSFTFYFRRLASLSWFLLGQISPNAILILV